MSDTDFVQAHVFVSGRVQGVFYRMFVHQQATKLGISGYVHNLNDGRVEAVFQGSSDKIHALIKQVHIGPNLARVIDVIIKWEDVSKPISKRFTILY
jgi:acylphosphatase